jgi:hypothetical protein
MPKVTIPGTLSVDDAMATISSGLDGAKVTAGRAGTGTFLVQRGGATGAVVRVRAKDGGTQVTSMGVIPSIGVRLAFFIPGIILVMFSVLGNDSARNAWLGLIGALVLFAGLGLMLRNTGGIARQASNALANASPRSAT